MRCIRLAVVNGMAGHAIHRRRIRVHAAVAGDAIGVHIVTSEAGLVRAGQSRWFVDQCRVTARFRVSLSVAVARLAGVIRDASFTSFALRMRIRAPGAGLVFMTVRTQRRRFGLRCCRSGLGGLRGGRSGQKQTAEEERDPCRSRFHRNLHVVDARGDRMAAPHVSSTTGRALSPRPSPCRCRGTPRKLRRDQWSPGTSPC